MIKAKSGSAVLSKEELDALDARASRLVGRVEELERDLRGSRAMAQRLQGDLIAARRTIEELRRAGAVPEDAIEVEVVETKEGDAG